MSQVKFQQSETIRTTGGPQMGGPQMNGPQMNGPQRNGPQMGGAQMGGAQMGGPGPRGGPQQPQDFMHEVGNALTQGAGPGGYLAVRRADLTVLNDSH